MITVRSEMRGELPAESLDLLKEFGLGLSGNGPYRSDSTQRAGMLCWQVLAWASTK